jgi:hypothetical protein
MAGNKSQTTSTSSAPWKAAQPAMKTALGDAQNIYKSGEAFKPYTGSTVVPFANQTIQGMNNMQGAAERAQGAFNQNFGNVSAMANDGGLNDLQRGSVDRLKSMADGSMMNANPFMEDVIKRTSQDIAGSTNLMASAAGRYGSGGHQNVLNDSIGDMASQMRLRNYDTERGYMQDAIGSLFNAGQQQRANVYGGTDALMRAFGGQMAPGQALMDVGSNYEDLATRTMNDQLRIFNETQAAPKNAVEWLNAIATGAGSMGGTGQTVAQGPSRLQSGLGGALGGGTMFGTPGAIGGGLLGAFG